MVERTQGCGGAECAGRDTGARMARARLVIPFHFSPRYMGCEAELREELEAARVGG
ncbi:MAG TPA: hypothetical protein VLT92_10045 [Burkholderiales bacterium]|nr:hypothetical protein [Burkholderiales bacterium]